MDFAQLLEALRRRWPLVLVLALLGGAAGAAQSLLSPPRFEASTTVFFSLEGGETVNELAQGSDYTQSLVQSYAEIAQLPVVLAPVAESLGVEGGAVALGRAVSVEAPADTSLLQVVVTDASAQRAASIADAVAARITATSADLAPTRVEGGGVVQVTTVEAAVVPDEPVSPPLALWALAGVAAGGLLGLGVLLLQEILAAPVHDRAAVRRLTSAPVLAEVPRDARAGRRPVPTRTHPGDARADAYRMLRTNVRFLQADGGVRVVVVAAASPGGGATGTALNLAVTTAEIGARVLLVEGDLRSPELADLLDLPPEPGLTAVLAGSCALEDAVGRWGTPAVDVLVAGAVTSNPSELLASPRAEHVLAEVRSAYDLVVVNAPALLHAADGAALAALADGAVVVVDSRRTPQRQLASALERLELAGAPALGVVLTRTRSTPQQRGAAGRGAPSPVR